MHALYLRVSFTFSSWKSWANVGATSYLVACFLYVCTGRVASRVTVERRKRALVILVFVAVNVSKTNGLFYLVETSPFMAGRGPTRSLSPAFPSAILAINRRCHNVWRKYISSIRVTNATNRKSGG